MAGEITQYEQRYLARLGSHGLKIKKYLEGLSLEEKKKLLKTQMKLDHLRMLAMGMKKMRGNNLQAALKYAKLGWHIHPCKKDKRPYLQGWPQKATTDVAQIKAWWGKYPDALIGCACGTKSGIFVIDIDPPNGEKSWTWLTNQYGTVPVTLMQRTGRGGRQLFFKYKGKISNSASKLGENIDVRGEGGYVILPPSIHPNGNKYQWLNKARVADPPQWLVELLAKKEEPIVLSATPGKTTPYGKKVLASLLAELAQSVNGNRNDTLNRVAFVAGQYIAGGEINESDFVDAAIGIASAKGLGMKEIKATINSGLKNGKLEPKTAPRKEDLYYIDDTVDVSNVSTCKQSKQESAACKQDVSNVSERVSNVSRHANECKQNVSKRNPTLGKHYPDTIMGAIAFFIENSRGSFTTRDLDQALGLTTRREKNARSRALNLYINKNIIKRDNRIAGKYYILDREIEWIDIENTIEKKFDIELPLALSNYVIIPPKAVIVLAGTSNSGKTSFILNTLYLNFSKPYEKIYLMSEMGDSEYISRIKNFPCPLSSWRNIKAASKSAGFDGIISHFNPNGLTCIDYLEDVQGEYFRMASDIRAIYDALDQGVAFIAIQKHSKAEVGRGGEATLEKARLYMTLDTLAVQNSTIICALKIVKLKHFSSKNLQNHEIHFEIRHGTEIEPMSDWQPSWEVDREKAVREYTKNPDPDDYMYFWTKAGFKKRVSMDQVRRWQKTYTNIDVYQELDKVGSDSRVKPFLRDNGWFFQLAGILAKRNKEKEGN